MGDGRLSQLTEWLDGHTNFEVVPPSRAKVPTLDRIRELCHVLGDPQQASPVIHLTGTNGKGSTGKILTSILMAHGLSVGTYSSPDLNGINERLCRNGEPIDDESLEEVLRALEVIEPILSSMPTRFELLTAAAFWWFADVAVDVSVIEVGLGGRWDATNVVHPEVAVVTNISYDHVEILGPTLLDIAGEKAGIFKGGATVVVGETAPELVELFRQTAESVGAENFWVRSPESSSDTFGCDVNQVAVGGRLLDIHSPGASYTDLFLPLHGAHQGDNASCALAAAEAFFGSPVDEDVVREAFALARVPGRLEVVGHFPTIVIDGAHNVAGADVLAKSLKEEMAVDGEVVAVVGMLEGRDPSAMLQSLAKGGIKVVVACRAPSPRAISPSGIVEAARATGLTALEADTVDEALVLAKGRAGDNGIVVVTGSLYVVASARRVLVPAER